MLTKPIRAGLLAALCLSLFTIAYTTKWFSAPAETASRPVCCANPQPHHNCVMKTMLGLENSEALPTHFPDFKLPEEAAASVQKGLSWLAEAQAANGGWGAGTHARQDIIDSQAITADPATTALVSLAILRTGSTLDQGSYARQLKEATQYLLKAVEEWPDNQPYLTTLTGTQPQSKLGQNIDAILTAQYLTNLLRTHEQHPWKTRIKQCLEKTVARIESQQDEDGSWKGGGWAPVLQSALADNALESAKDAGIAVDSTVLVKSKNYQKSNFDPETKSAVTGKAAGVVLYSLSSTSRSSAKEAKKARDIIEKAKKSGTVRQEEELNEASLQKAGIDPSAAKELSTAYQVNENAKKEAIREDVMSGFGSNGGEEFLSYLMTGESMILQGGNEWKSWFDMMTKKLVDIQNKDGSWNGHHCITSPVFCTATCLLILSIHNDIHLSLPSKPF
jgi:hypothetical protein